MSINLIQGRSISLDSIMNTPDNCNECNSNKRKTDCNKCGNALCKSLKCSWVFPHKYNIFDQSYPFLKFFIYTFT